jgi:hypothetical protein
MKVNDEFCIRFKYADTLLYGISSTDNNNPNFGIMKELIAKKLTEEFGNYFQEMKDGENTDFLFKKETAISFHRDKLCDNLKEDIEIIAEKCIRCIEILKKLPNPPIAESVKKIV